MRIEVAGKTYPISNAFSVLLEYVAEFGASYITDTETPALAAVRLTWCAIRGEKPPFPEFLAAAAEDPSFVAVAGYVRDRICTPAMRERDMADASVPERPLDELDVAQMLLTNGVPAALFDRLPVYQLIDLVSRKLDGAPGSGAESYTVATPETIRELRNKIRGR